MMNFELDYKVIDMHIHMGPSYNLYYTGFLADDLVEDMDRRGIEFSVCCPCEDLFTANSRREMIADAMKRHPGRIMGYYTVNPMMRVDVDDIRRQFADNPGYVGLKFLPDYHRTALTDDIFAPAMELADKNNMLVLSHTWGISMDGECCNSADKVVGILDKYKNITLIMGHSIQGQIDQAIEIAKAYPNAYLDMCDTCRLNGVVEKMVEKVGSHRMVFGTDWPMHSVDYTLGSILGARISDKDKKNILRDTALHLLESTNREFA